MDELLAKIHKQWGKPAHCEHCLGEEDLHTCSECASVYCSAKCQEMKDTCQLIGVKTRKRDRSPEKEEKPISLTKDAMSVVLQFLELEDLKNVSLASRKMTQLARQAMINNYTWDYTPEMMQKIRPKMIVVRSEWFEQYLEDPNIFETNLITHVHFELDNLHIGNLMKVPDSIESVVFSNVTADIIDLSGNTYLTEVDFEETEEHEDGFNGILLLPSSVTHLDLGPGFNQPIGLPPNLNYLGFNEGIFNSVFNQPFPEGLPSTLKQLHLGGDYNQLLNLPRGLEIFHMGADFNQPVQLPDGLRQFIMGHDFNQPIHIPNSVEWLVFGASFNQPNIVLPSNLRSFSSYSIIDGLYTFPCEVETIRIRQDSTCEIVILPGTSYKRTRIIRF